MRMSRFKTYTLATILLFVATVYAQSTNAATSTTPTKSSISSTPTTNFVLPTLPSVSSATSSSIPSNTPSPTSPGNATLRGCPGPLIPNTMNLDIPTCANGCCIKCPAVSSFYPPNETDSILLGTYIVRNISLACVVFMSISYLVLPGKRSQPHISVLFLLISLSLWYAAFDVMPGTSNACVNEFEASTWHNSNLCAAQGVLIIYLTQTSVLWCALLIFKLHLLAVWQSDIIDQYYGWLCAFCWILPLGFAIPVAAKNLSQFPGIGFSCLVGVQDLNLYLFYPLAVYIYPAILCHIFTVFKMIQIAILSSQVDTAMSQMSANQRMKITSSMQAKRLLRGQWRPALMLATVMASITVFWLFYYVDAHHMHGLSITTDWVQIWLGCIGAHFASGVSSDETQTICSNLIKDHLPSIPWFAASESLVAIIGIIITPVFVGKKEFWSEWATLISSFIGRHGPGTDSERQGSADEGKPSGIDYNENHVHYDHHNLRKGYNDELPPHLIADNKIFHANNELEDPQLYDMDELLDREYDLQETKLQRGTSVGSRNDMFSVPNQDPPRYLSSPIPDPYDMSYSSPAKEVEPWSSSSQTLTSPSKAYLVANDISDRYVEKPVVPRPVPRASLRSKNIQQESNDEQVSSSPSSLQSPVYAPTPLSPMPPKPQSMSRSNSTLRKKEPDSVPIVKKVNGSPSASYNSPSPLRSALLSSNDSREQIMVASRESVTELGHGSIIGRGLSKILPHRQSTDTPKPYNPRNEDIRIQSSTPPVPLKSPARRQDSIRRGQHNQPSNGQNEIQRSNSVPHDINGIFLTQ